MLNARPLLLGVSTPVTVATTVVLPELTGSPVGSIGEITGAGSPVVSATMVVSSVVADDESTTRDVSRVDAAGVSRFSRRSNSKKHRRREWTIASSIQERKVNVSPCFFAKLRGLRTNR